METITQILGGAQILLGINFDIQDSFEEFLTEEHRCFLTMLRVIEEFVPSLETRNKTRGRHRLENQPILRAFLARHFFRTISIESLRNRLKSDANLRQICGFITVPSAATFSRRLAEFINGKPMMARVLTDMVTQYHNGRIVGHISRDSTAIEAREPPVNKKSDVSLKPQKKAKRGRPRKGDERPSKLPSNLEKQVTQKPAKSLQDLDKECAYGCKKNSQGNVSFWKGYKLHLDITDLGIPITAIVTGANVHDSQTAIPMEQLTAGKIQHLYSVMDSAYDATIIHKFIRDNSRVPLIDPHKRRDGDHRQFDPAEKERFKIRTSVERANSHLKDWLIPGQIFVRGFEKMSFVLLCSVVCLAAMKILQYFILPEALAA